MTFRLNASVRVTLVALLALLALLALPLNPTHALRWGGLSNQDLVYSYLNEVCRDGMTAAVIRFTNRPSGPPPQAATIEFRLGASNGPLLTSQVIPVTGLPRPPLQADLDFPPSPLPPEQQPPYHYYTRQKVLWGQLLDSHEPLHSGELLHLGAQVVLAQVADSPSFIDPATVSDCLTGERNQTIELRNAFAGLPPSGDKKSDRHIGRAVEALNRSLAPNLWQTDGLLLTSQGATVFNELIVAVRQLGRIDHPNEAVADAMNALPDVACGLANNAIEAAVIANGDAGAINKAQAAVARGWASVAAGDPIGGIRQFKRAWLHAQRAVGRWGDEVSIELMEESIQPVEP